MLKAVILLATVAGITKCAAIVLRSNSNCKSIASLRLLLGAWVSSILQGWFFNAVPGLGSLVILDPSLGWHKGVILPSKL